MSQPAPIHAWPALLRGAAGPVPSGRPGRLGPGAYVDDFAVACGVMPAATPLVPPTAIEARLWRAVVDSRAEVESAIATDDGPLIPPAAFRTIEVWTESELCALHALWRVVRERRRDDLRTRLETARDWHLEHTQPDNGTGRPWALHVFLLAGSEEPRLYAETLLHNVRAAAASVEPLTALILHDAAREVEIATAR
ncbi:MAG: hypothetical protein KDA22_08945 [Phycisphaerales bacterium]|nr:hypothetical protein [Phycisphaerales bacterium]